MRGAVDEKHLWQVYLEHKDKKVRQELISFYAPLVKQVAGRMVLFTPSGADFDDLLGYGALGLVQAVDSFDPQRGVQFNTFAHSRIRGAILDGIRQLDWRSRGSREREKGLQEALAHLEQRLGRTPTDEELARELGLGLREMQKLWQETSQSELASLEAAFVSPDTGEAEGNLKELLSGPPEQEPERQALRNQLRQELAQAIGRLPEKEKLVVALYYYEELTLKEIGAVLEVTESRVCQLHGRALRRLRGSLSRKKNKKKELKELLEL